MANDHAAFLPSYTARIGHTGPLAPSLNVLRALTARHPEAIAFESIDPFMGRGVPIDPPAIRAKLLASRRGGYCHEQNALFHDVLAEIGFTVTALGARVVWARPDGIAPLTHRLTLVDLPEGRFIADVGFGGQTPPAPLLLEPGLEQPTPHGTYRITQDNADHALEMRLKDRWQALYRFRLDAQSPVDFEMANWYTATHPRGRFTQNLICARIAGGRRINLANRILGIREADGSLTARALQNATELAEVLETLFDLDIPVPIETIWSRVIAARTGATSGPD